MYYTGGAQWPPKRVKFDFYYIHAVNSAIFLPVFASLPWLSMQKKIRLLEFKGRLDLLFYVTRGSMEPRLNEITDYKPTRSWTELFTRVNEDRGDDGHAAKFLRLLAYGEKACKPFEEKHGFKIKGDMWNRLGNMGEHCLFS